MFCPICKTEYRRGFTTCADCGVDLVATLADAPVGDDVPRNSEGLKLLWSGTNHGLGEGIDSALEAAHIFHKLTGKDLGFLPAFPGSVGFIWIDPKDRAAARAIMEKVLESPDSAEPEFQDQVEAEGARVNPLGFDRRVFNRVPDQQDGENEDELPEPEDSRDPTPDDIVEDFDPDEATTEVWSGDDSKTADYMKLCLGGVGIGCVLHENSGKSSVFVLPAQEKRAREIVREIVEGAPPR